MQKKKDKLFDKIVKKNYNDELETVLETKDFSENVKSTLLSILYKVEAAYKDVMVVKQDVESKDEYLQNIIDIIKNKCDFIKLIHIGDEETSILENHTFFVDTKKKYIECYPIERKLLYAISKISKKDRIIKDDYFLVNITLSDLINVGHNINMVEPLRDFNGYSWTTLAREIESIWHNLVYQNVRILLGHEFMNKWVSNTEFMMDYFDMFQGNLETLYGIELSKDFVCLLFKISVLLEIKYDSSKIENIKQIKCEVEESLSKMQDMANFVQELTRKKLEITAKIRNVDTIINNKSLLEEEYIKRNSQLPLDKKIFSMRVLGEIMVKEREEYFEQIDKLNDLMNPQKFVNHKKELEEKQKYLSLLDVSDVDGKIEEEMIEFQKSFLKCFEIRLEKVQDKQELVSFIYQYRYYLMLPFNQEKSIHEVEALKSKVVQVTKKLLQKAHQLKVIAIISKDEDIDYVILKNIFTSRIINLQDLNLKVTKEKEKFYVQMFDENAFEEKIELGTKEEFSIEELEVKLGRKQKLFE